MKKHILTFLIFICLAIVLVISLPKENKIEEYDTEEIELAIYINDEETNSIPSKEGNIYDETRSSCTNGAYIIWDYESWSPVVKNMNEYKTKCELYFKTGYKENILNGTDPVLKDPLIPVTIESDGTVKKADIGSEWYNYTNKEWANAVILFDESEDYLAGEVIPEEKIESYFVWIPKYRYQLWDLGLYDSLTSIDSSKVHEIPIIFGDYNTSDVVDGECTTPMESGATGNCTLGDYMTHPAFLSIPSTGFWVGKFSTTYQNTNEDIYEPENISIKPNQYAFVSGDSVNIHLNSYNYKRNLDSHMIKNTEWGAVAYLSYSPYGIQNKIRINNNSNQITGYAANNEPTCSYTGTNEECNRYCNDGTCNTAYPNSVLASTTGNISGIFDMSGQKTITMSFMEFSDGTVTVGQSSELQSGFKGTLGDGSINSTGLDLPEKKYYDLYLFNNNSYNTIYNRRILGDATGETGPFESNHLWVEVNISSWNHSLLNQFFSIIYPIGARSYYYFGGNVTDIFAFQGIYSFEGSVSRLILTPGK